MNSLPIINELSGFAPNAILIGEGVRADCIWTRKQFVAICVHMLNENSQTEFLHMYWDSEDRPRFVKAGFVRADRRIPWAWDTITGRAKHKIAVGFYPWNSRFETRWGAMDLDAHDGDAQRARTLAGAAWEVLQGHPQLYLVLCTSGSNGWHLFAFTEEFYPVRDWVLLFKRTASIIGTEIKSGRCEIFPDETRGTSRPYGIRAPGTWNPKTDRLGAIVFDSTRALFQKKRRKEESPYLYLSSNRAKTSRLNDTEEGSFYSGGKADWIQQFAIVQPSTRHAQLRALVHAIFRQVGYQVARRNAEAQYLGAKFQPNASLAEHLEEFEELWAWTAKQWLGELSEAEQERLALLRTEVERDLFRILRSFAVHANSQGATDFPFPIEHVGNRLGVSFQHVSKLRRRFTDSGIIVQTEPARTNRCAARFRWCRKAD